jgi:hypothetical protein
MVLDTVQSLWVGGDLSNMERLSIKSFLKNGHEYVLYVYDSVGRIPDGVIVKDANEIIPREQLFLVRGGYSSFSDFFRWKLILEKGGWWVDTDAVCLRPLVFDSDSEYVFIGGLGKPGSNDCITSGLFRAPAHSSIMECGWTMCQRMNPATMSWGEAGPPLFTELVHKFGFQKYIVPGRLFFPMFWAGAPDSFTNPGATLDFEDAYSVHLFNELWRQAGRDKNGTYPSTSVFEQLKKEWGS